MSQKGKLSPEEKVKLVQRCLAGEIGVREAAQAAGVHHSVIGAWIAQYEAEGAVGFMSRGRNRVYNAEIKLQAVLGYLAGQGSYLNICKKYKIRNSTQLKHWVKMYNAHGDFNSVKHSGGGSYMKQGRDTTLEERIQIAKECYGWGKNYGEMALKYNVSYQQVRNWTLRYEELGEAGLEDRRGRRKKDQEPRTELEKAQIEIERLKHELYMAEMERDLLKKLDEVVRRDAYRK